MSLLWTGSIRSLPRYLVTDYDGSVLNMRGRVVFAQFEILQELSSSIIPSIKRAILLNVSCSQS